MLDFFRSLGKSSEDKDQETITAYLDENLTPGERDRFERQMAVDAALRDEVEQQKLIKANLQRLPLVRAPRNFTLDPALYGRPEPATSARLYPALRTATVLVGIFFMIAVGAALISPQGGSMDSLAQAPMAREADAVLSESLPSIEQAPVDASAEEAAEAKAESDLLVESEEIVSEAELEMEAPAEGIAAEVAPAAAEEMLTLPPAAEAVEEAAPEADFAAEEPMTDGEMEEGEAELGAAAPAMGSARQLTKEASSDEVAAESQAIEAAPTLVAGQQLTAVARQQLTATAMAEAALGEPMLSPTPIPVATASPPTGEELAEVEPTPRLDDEALAHTVTADEAPGDTAPQSVQRARRFSSLTGLIVVLGLTVILLTGATLLVRRSM